MPPAYTVTETLVSTYASREKMLKNQRVCGLKRFSRNSGVVKMPLRM